ncbi:SDR family oxidoreductase [Spiractinospora alimapuensis]|uniref:SDR family NAD(P)-dependent oxidoreductase n=1 Tax=Spiractinospora alimapuensis TaxID=2820884 RepID=UPI001F316C23|nr:SDR family oxidoreductase [Spiractinospora alimapuensis]QVQ54704.1 SDR family oxidoreductase [Spiractinospora alimapuensis]
MSDSRGIAVVTGATGGIGRALVDALVRDGCRVVGLGRDRERLDDLEREHASAPVTGLVCDITDEDDVAATFAELDPVSVLVNNAGISETAPVARTSLADWEAHLRVNATSAFLATRAVLPGMRDRDHGRVVFVASTAGLEGTRYTSAYTASKHAMLGLARSVAAEVAGTGVTSNAVCPTFVRSPMTERSVARISGRTGRGVEEAEAALATASPLGRLVEPAEVAAAVSYLASSHAAAVNGQSLIIDGGGIQR